MQHRFIRPLFIASLACTSAALACPPDESSTVQDPFGQQVVFMRGNAQSAGPGVSIARAGPGRNSSTSTATSITDGDTKVDIVSKVTTTIDDQGNETRNETGETKVVVAGKEIPQDRIKRVGNMLQVFDEQGGVMRTVQLPETRLTTMNPLGGNRPMLAQALGQARVRAGSPLIPGKGGTFVLGGGAGDHPKVMLGVTMEDADDALAEHLHLNTNDITVIGGVNADTPAAKAGLQKWDVIVSVDGHSPAPQKLIREILQGKEPGQAVTLGVISGGQKKDVTATLEAFDASKLGVSVQGMNIGGGPDDDQIFTATIEDPVQLEQLMKQLHDQYDIDLNLGDLVAPQRGAVTVPAPRGGGRAGPGAPAQQPGLYRFRAAPPNAGPDDDRIRMMEERLQVMQEMLRRLEERLAAPRGPGGPPPAHDRQTPPPPPSAGPRA